MFLNYLKLSFKVLLRRKFFTFISLFGIAVTLTVLMVATAIIDHTFGPMTPEVHAERTLVVNRIDIRSEDNHLGSDPGYRFVDRYVRGLPGAELISLSTDGCSNVAVYLAKGKAELCLKRTDGEFWQVLDFEFLEGGPITLEDEANANRVAVINRDAREKVFNGESAVGKTITIDGRGFRVAGVVENVSTLRSLSRSDIWVPISTAKSSDYRHAFIGGFQALVLARDAGDFPALKAEFQSRLESAELPEGYDRIEAAAETYFERTARDFFHGGEGGHKSYKWHMKALIVLLMVLFMVLPTINLVNINVSRILERASEIGVRKAFGAASTTLVGQFVVENVLLTVFGGILGLVGSLTTLAFLSDSGFIPHAAFTLNFRIFFWGFVITVFFGLFSGVYPAWKMSRLHPVAALNGTLNQSYGRA